MFNEDVRQTAVSVSAIPNIQAVPEILDSTAIFPPEGSCESPSETQSAASLQATPTLLESALYLRSYGFNVIPVTGKVPIGSWKQYQDRLITFDEMESFPWDRATGIAVINGIGGIRNLDIDIMGDESILTECLCLMGLPSDYPWVERSGFGSHIFLFVQTILNLQ